MRESSNWIEVCYIQSSGGLSSTVIARRRRYHSPHRQERAEGTRRRIVTSARCLFARDGYAATSMEAIAHAAGIAVPTVYAVMGSKRSILLALLDSIERDAGVEHLRIDLDPPTYRTDPCSTRSD